MAVVAVQPGVKQQGGSRTVRPAGLCAWRFHWSCSKSDFAAFFCLCINLYAEYLLAVASYSPHTQEWNLLLRAAHFNTFSHNYTPMETSWD